MCSVTFWPRRGGYLLAMNRDEKWTRPAALPPTSRRVGGQMAVYPSESGGGTWIGLNDAGVSFALVNWYAVPRRLLLHPVSRGEVVAHVLGAAEPDTAKQILLSLPLTDIQPFRLTGVFPSDKSIREWRWNGEALMESQHEWTPRQWLSSGLDEPTAQRVRSDTFVRRCRHATAGEVSWLRDLHASHDPERGAFSVCVHREDAGTVSYTEIAWNGRRGSLRYVAGAPCFAGEVAEQTIELNPACVQVEA